MLKGVSISGLTSHASYTRISRILFLAAASPNSVGYMPGRAFATFSADLILGQSWRAKGTTGSRQVCRCRAKL